MEFLIVFGYHSTNPHHFGSIMERITFEEALKNLESIVSKLEENSVTLEESVNLYEEGMKLSKYCSEILDKAEIRIEKVNEQSSK